MSILAAPRYKQRISIDPQNLGWKEDDQKFSKKLMQKMGWNDGDGLGKNRQGDSNNVKLKANYSGKGLGADKLASYDTTWIGHHDDFADLLSALNKNKEKPAENEAEGAKRAENLTKELNKNSMRRRIACQKFTKAKDTTRYTDNDRSAVMGIGLKRHRQQEEDTVPIVKKEEPSDDSDSKQNTIVSTMSVAEYFAAKMAALKAKKPIDVADIKQENDEDDGVKQEVVDKAVKKRLKKERRRLRELEGQQEVVIKDEGPNFDTLSSDKFFSTCVVPKEEPMEEEDEAERKRLKKERKEARKLAKQLAEQSEEPLEDHNEEGCPNVKRMRMDVEVKQEPEDEEPVERKTKKNKKSKTDE